jgi:hypothetical protein
MSSGIPIKILYGFFVFLMRDESSVLLSLLHLIIPIIFGEGINYEALHYATFSSLPSLPSS